METEDATLTVTEDEIRAEIQPRPELRYTLRTQGDGGQFSFDYSWHDVLTEAVITSARSKMPNDLTINHNAGNGKLLVARRGVPADKTDRLTYHEERKVREVLEAAITAVAERMDYNTAKKNALQKKATEAEGPSD